jgi:hypothetical protein
MTRVSVIHRLLRRARRVLLLITLWPAFAQQAAALTNQVVFFNGFGSDAGPGTGLGILNTTLAANIPDYLGMVFEWTQRQEAFDWVQQQTANRSTLVLIGHSFGGNSALQLANDFLKPVGVAVDLTIQIDPVKNFNSGANDVLPTNVEVGLNYYQIATGFFEPQGEDVVRGATNINVETLFNDRSITHTSIDNDPRLHALIGQNIFANLNRQDADYDLDGDVDGGDFLVWQRGGSPRSLGSADLALWQSQYASDAVVVASSAVPEPTALILLAGVTIVAICSSRASNSGR